MFTGTASRSVRLLVVDDQALVREAFRMLLESQPGLTVVSEASNFPESISAAKATQPDVILMDLDLGGESSHHNLSKLLDVAPNAKILVITGTPNEELHQEALRNGAMGLVKKLDAADVLLKAIKTVNSGEVWIDSGLMTKLMSSIWDSKPSLPANPPQVNTIIQDQPATPKTGTVSIANDELSHDALQKIAFLTDREKEVISLVAEGLRNQQIAEKLFISPITVRHHLTSIFSKLDLNNRFELAIFAYRCGLADMPQ